MVGHWFSRARFIIGLAIILRVTRACAQTEVEVTSATAPLMGGSQQIATLDRHAHFVVEQVNGDWLLVTAPTPQGAKRGWIQRPHTRELFLPPREPLEASQNITLEQCQQAAAKLGLLMTMEKWPDAARAAEDLVRLYYGGMGSEDEYVGRAELQLAFCYVQVQRAYEAERFLLHSIRIMEQFKDSKDNLIMALTALADLYRQEGEYAKGERLSARGLELAEAAYGKEDARTAPMVALRGGLLADSGKLAEAEPYLNRALAIYEKARQPALSEAMLVNLGTLYERMNQLDRAQAIEEQALKRQEARLGSQHIDLATTLSALATVQEKRGEFAAAEASCRRGLKIMAASPRANLDARIGLLRGLGTTLVSLGQVGQAEASLLEAMELEREASGSDSLQMAMIHWALGRLYNVRRQNEKAAGELAKSLAIFAARVGTEHADYLGAAQSAGIVYKDLGRFDEAQTQLRKVIESRKRRRESTWMPMVNLAGVYAETGKLAEAEALYTEAIPQGEKEAGPNHPDVIQSLALLSEVYLAQGKPEKAEPALKRVIQLQEKRLGANHPNLAVPLRDLAVLEVRAGRFADAIATFDRARRIMHAYLHDSLPWFSEHEQIDALRGEEGPLATALSLAFERPDDTAIVDRTAEWVLNGKAVAFEVLAQRALLTRSATTPELATIVRELEQVRQKLANQVITAPLHGTQSGGEIEALSQREQALQKQLGQLGGAEKSPARWVELRAVRDALPKDAMLVEVAMIHRFDYQGPLRKQQSDRRYVAWVIPPSGEGNIHFIELGREPQVTQAIRAYLDLSDQSAQKIAAAGDVEAERSFRAALEKAAQYLLRPLEKQLAAKRHWVISSDWFAWAVPWSALPLADGRYAIEDHVISYRISGRKLVDDSSSQGEPAAGSAVVFADPNFDLRPNESAATPAFDAKPRFELPDDPSARGIERVADRVPRNWTRLPGTADEAAAVLPSPTSWLGATPEVFERDQALEARFKKLHRPRVLVISTHGYFLGEETAADSSAAASSARHARLETAETDNKLLRCGLVLAGANRRGQALAQQDDGILTGLEILAADLRGTDLVVLSACETAAGIVSQGEGVAGLQQVFQLAGARSVVATLWTIPDAETAELMSTFWQSMAKKKSKAEALREAQVAMIKARRQSVGAAHPYFWAAFTLTGAAD